MGSDTFYNERKFLWEVVRLVQAVTGVRTAPPVRAEVYAGSTRPHTRRASFLWEVGTSYNERRFLWGVIRFVWAVSHIWTAPPVRAEVYAGSTRPANQFAFKRTCRIRGVRGFYGKRYVLYRAAASMGSGALCLGCILRKENPAPQARIACGFNPLLCALAASAACGDSMGSDTFYNKRRFL